ncbi:MAG: hypothetical protein AAGD14_14465, partial [Planctomycetota bacterium]
MCFLLLGAAWAYADTEDDVVAELTKADAKRFAELAARDEPDPWLVADHLARDGRRDLALRFARSKPRPAVEGLDAYLETREPHAAIQQVIDRALLRLEDEQATRPQLAEVAQAIGGVLGGANAFERAQLLALRSFARTYGGDVESGQRDLLDAVAAARSVGWRRGAADGLGTASENARVLYDYEKAIELAQQELALRWQLGDRARTTRHLRRLVEVMSEVGEAPRALRLLASWGARLGDPIAVDRASLLLRLADPDAALTQLDGIEGARARMLAGDAHRQLGREAGALAAYREAIALLEKTKDRTRLGHALGNAGISLIRLGRAREATPLLDRAQLVFEAAKERGLVALAVLHRGDAQLAAGGAAAALRLFRSVRSFARRTNDAWLEAEALRREGRAQLALGEFEPARKAFAACRELAQMVGLFEQHAAGSLGEAEVYLRTNRAKLASAAAVVGERALLPLIEGRPVPPGDEARRLFEALAEARVRAELRLLSDRDLWLALETRLIGIPRYTRSETEGWRRSAMSEREAREEDELRRTVRQLALFEDRARQEEDRVKAAAFSVERREAESKLDELIEQVRLRRRPGSLLLFPVVSQLTAVRQRLTADEALVSLARDGSRVIAFVVTRLDAQRHEVQSGALPDAAFLADRRVTLIAPPDLQRFPLPGRELLRAPSATEFEILRGRRATGDPVVLARPPSARELRARFLAGEIRILAPLTPVPEAAATRMRQRVASGEPVLLPRSSDWSWWGRRR